MTIGVAIIGTGYIGKIHIETLLRIPSVRLMAVADANLDQARKLADQYHIPQVTDDFHTLIDAPEIEVFHNCTPNHLHYDINKVLLNNKKHVLSEKPLSLTSQQAAELCELAAKYDRETAINFCYRYYPSIQEAAFRIRNGEIGDLHTVFGAYFQDWLLKDTDYNWRLDHKYSGTSNTMADIGSHWMDLAQFVSGSKITEVMADLNTILPVRKKSRGETLTFTRNDQAVFDEVPVDLDDYGSVLLHFENGAKGAFSVCQLCAGRKCSIDLQCYGKKAALAWNHERPTQLWIGQRDQANEYLIENPLLMHETTAKYARLPGGHPLGYFDAVYNLFAEFYRRIELKNTSENYTHDFPSFTEGLDEMLLLEAILTSHQEHRWVQVER